MPLQLSCWRRGWFIGGRPVSATMLFHIVLSRKCFVANRAVDALFTGMLFAVASCMTRCGKGSSTGVRCGIRAWVFVLFRRLGRLCCRRGIESGCCWWWDGWTRQVAVTLYRGCAMMLISETVLRLRLMVVVMVMTWVWRRTCGGRIVGAGRCWIRLCCWWLLCMMGCPWWLCRRILGLVWWLVGWCVCGFSHREGGIVVVIQNRKHFWLTLAHRLEQLNCVDYESKGRRVKQVAATPDKSQFKKAIRSRDSGGQLCYWRGISFHSAPNAVRSSRTPESETNVETVGLRTLWRCRI